MSGGAGPTRGGGGGGGGIRPPRGEDPAERPLASPPPHRRHFPTIHHLNSLAIVVFLSVSRMVSLPDFAFFAFSLAYLHFLARVAFPSAAGAAPEPPFFGESRALRIYVLVAAAVGLFAPAAYILWGVLGGDKEGVGAAAPHLFLLSCQVLMEGVTFAGGFSLPIRAFVPISYNTKRLFTIADWLRAEMEKAGEEEEDGPAPWRLHMGRGIAIANLALWSFNLLGFLLPVYLPWVFKRYYGQKPKD